MIDFNEIKELFPEDIWDMGVLSGINYRKVINKPVKALCHFKGELVTNRIHSPETIENAIVFARASDVGSNYSLYLEAEDLLKPYIDSGVCEQIYTNFKEAAIMSGVGVRAKNSLVYNEKFGFQCKLCAFTFYDEIVNVPDKKIDQGLLDLCDGCDDCIVNCPANAIHEDFIDSRSCDVFVGLGNHPTISSVKWFWYEKMNPPIPEDVVASWDKMEDYAEHIKWSGRYEMTPNGLTEDGKVIDIPHCRECQKQPRCSKRPIDNEQ